MGSIAVNAMTELGSLFLGIEGGGAEKAGAAELNVSFSQIFGKAAGNSQEMAGGVWDSQTESEGVKARAGIQKSSAGRVQEKPQAAEGSGLEEAAEEAGEKMVEETAKTFQVTEEEVEAAMEELGLTALDLLNPENLAALALALHPGTDALSLMTDERLSAGLKSLMQTAEALREGLGQELQLTPRELTQALDALTEGKAVETAAVTDSVLDGAVSQQPVQEGRQAAEDGAKTGQGIRLASEGEGAGENPRAASGSQAGNAGGEEQYASGRQSGQEGLNTALNQLAEAVEEAAQAREGSPVSGRDIITQITDYIRTTVKAETTEMELQLHPATLGSIKVQVTSRAGVLTAVFTTENEAVKAAMEAQMVQLKESFAEQGLKVEAVEVNVETKGFERNLNEEDPGQEEMQQRARQGRRIRLDGMGRLEEGLAAEDMSEGERLLADMMLRSGNRVDYTA